MCGNVAALEVGQEIHATIIGKGWESDIRPGTALINMYGNCGSLNDSRAVFVDMPFQNVVSWSAMMTACVQNGHGKEALQLFGQMKTEGLKLDDIIFISMLDACASVADLEEGREIYTTIVGIGWESKVVVGTAVVNMYGKCGRLHDARAVFAGMPQQNVVSWSAMIAACAQSGHGKVALQLFGQMLVEGVKPDEITFISVLTACGLVADGRRYFTTMKKDYGIRPSVEHYLCMIDLLGRRGLLEEAEDLIISMPFANVAAAWLSLLSSCRIHRDVERGESAGNVVLELDPRNASLYVLLASMYANAGRLDDVVKV